MQKNYNEWSKQKEILDKRGLKGKKVYPKEREVWVCSVGINIGFEQNGNNKSFERPVLVFKKFNNRMVWGIPLTSKQKKIDFYCNFTDPNEQEVSAIIAQMRLFSINRFDRKMYLLPEDTFMDIKHQFLRLI